MNEKTRNSPEPTQEIPSWHWLSCGQTKSEYERQIQEISDLVKSGVHLRTLEKRLRAIREAKGQKKVKLGAQSRRMLALTNTERRSVTELVLRLRNTSRTCRCHN